MSLAVRKFKALWGAALLSLFASIMLPPAQASQLYTFSSMLFTNCGATGQNGPTLIQCATNTYSAQSWTANTSNFNVISGIQYWTVPTSGSYTITAAGAKGGGITGGLGAIETGTFTLTQGSIIRILVGQSGAGSSIGSGGGGTFVVAAPYNTNESILVIAGGGGGYAYSTCTANTGGQTGPSPTGGSLGAASGGGGGGSTLRAGGVGFTNGAAVGASVYGGGGAGFGGDGGRYNNNTTASGLSFVNGGKGGDAVAGFVGGFGGGGGIGDRPGGGGGYSGGNSENSSCAIGGGSLNRGTNTSDAGNLNNGHGYVVVTYNAPQATTTSLQLTSGALTATFRTPVQLRAVTSVDGRVVFRQNGKNIPGCISVATVSSIATCNWRPSVRGSVTLTASYISGGGYASSTSVPLNVRIANRLSTR